MRQKNHTDVFSARAYLVIALGTAYPTCPEVVGQNSTLALPRHKNSLKLFDAKFKVISVLVKQNIYF